MEILDKLNIDGEFKHIKNFKIKGINDVYNCVKNDMIFIEIERIINKINIKSNLFIITTNEIYKNIYKKFKHI